MLSPSSHKKLESPLDFSLTTFGYFHRNRCALKFSDPLNAPYQVSRTMLLAHATAWRLYDSDFRAKQGGIISITLNSDWSEPKDPCSKADQEAATKYLQVL